MPAVYSETERGFYYYYEPNIEIKLADDLAKLNKIIADNAGIKNSRAALQFAFNIEGAKKEIMNARFDAAYENIRRDAE